MKLYAVRIPIRAIFTSWPDCSAVVSQVRYTQFKSFPTLDQARAYMEEGLVIQELQCDGDGEEQQRRHEDEDEDEEDKQDDMESGGGGGGWGGGGGRTAGMTANMKQGGHGGGECERERKRKAPAAMAAGKRGEGGGGGGGEIISLLSDTGEKAGPGEGLRGEGEQKKRLKREKMQGDVQASVHAGRKEEEKDEEDDEEEEEDLESEDEQDAEGCRNSSDDEEDDDDNDERSQATQTIPALPLPPPPPPPSAPSLPPPSSTTAAAPPPRPTTHAPSCGTLYFDGGSRGNPGIAGCGAVMYDGHTGQKLWSLSAYLGPDKTNNQAEYAALCFGLEEALQRGVASIQAFGDSTLVVRQVEGAWRVKNPGLKAWHAKAAALKKRFRRFTIAYVPRAGNGAADALANEGMDRRGGRGAVVVEAG